MAKANPRKGSNGALGTTVALLAIALAVANLQLSGPAQVGAMVALGLALIGCVARIGANSRTDKR
ncbi:MULTISPECIES: hypothetical protein [unclassified Streptomyces]|uniref:hypothetical protein n=1 Tax=unclassified Streptomyces TaxID=2593676 RepID=UPI00342FF70A